MFKFFVLMVSLCCAGASAQGFILTPAVPATPSVVLLQGLEVSVTWSDTMGADFYYVSPIINGVGSHQSTASSPYTYDVEHGSSYQFKVKACKNRYEVPGPVEPPIIPLDSSELKFASTQENCSEWSNPSSTITVPPKVIRPPVPAKPTATLSSLNMSVEWAVSANADFNYLLPIKNGVAAQQILATTPYIYDVSPGSSYRFKVKACKNRYEVPGPVEPPIISSEGEQLPSSTDANTISAQENCSAWSNASSSITVPSIPAIPQALLVFLSGNEATISWKSVTGATFYKASIYNRTKSQWDVEQVSSNRLVKTVTNGASYFVRVSACNDSGCSAPSSTSEFSIAPNSPQIDRIITQDISTKEIQMTVSWQAVDGVVSYKSQQRVNGTWGSEANNGESLSKIYTGSPGEKYAYRVRACNAGGCSGYSVREITLPSRIITYFHTDMQGSVIGESDSDGNLVNKKLYKPFGESKEND